MRTRDSQAVSQSPCRRLAVAVRELRTRNTATASRRHALRPALPLERGCPSRSKRLRHKLVRMTGAIQSEGALLRLGQPRSVITGVLLCFLASLATAHESPVDHVEREFRLWVAEGRLHLSCRLQLAERAALLQLHRMDTDGDGHISGAERDGFFTAQAGRLARGFTLELAGQPLSFTPNAAVRRDARLGQTFHFETPLPKLAAGRHAGRLADAHARAYPGPFRWVDAGAGGPRDIRVEPVATTSDSQRPAWLAVKPTAHSDSLALNFVVVIPP